MAFSHSDFNDGAGGFVPQDQSQMGNTPGGAPGSVEQKPRNDMSSVLPVTCRMILEANNVGNDGDAFKIDGRVIGMLSIVAEMRGWKQNGKEIVMAVTDGTATIHVTIFGEGVQKKLEDWSMRSVMDRPFMCRIHGHMRVFKGAACLLGISFQWVSDNTPALVHQMHHFHHVVLSHLYNKHGALKPQEGEIGGPRRDATQPAGMGGMPQQQQQQQQQPPTQGMYGQPQPGMYGQAPQGYGAPQAQPMQPGMYAQPPMQQQPHMYGAPPPMQQQMYNAPPPQAAPAPSSGSDIYSSVANQKKLIVRVVRDGAQNKEATTIDWTRNQIASTVPRFDPQTFYTLVQELLADGQLYEDGGLLLC